MARTEVGVERLADLLAELQGDPWLEFARRGGHSAMLRERQRFDTGSESRSRIGTRISAKQRLANAIGAPQAVVKIVRGGGTGTRSALATQLTYLARDGDLTLGEYGFDGSDFFVEGQSDISDLSHTWAARWERAEALDGRSAQAKAKTYHVIVSFPEGTDKTKAREAADTFTERFLNSGEFGDRWSHVRAWHTDRAHPHMHIVIDRRGASGKMMQINPKRAITPARLRALQVDAAAEHGLLMNDTPRITRGLRGTAKTSAAWRTEQRGIHTNRNADLRTRQSAATGLTGETLRIEAQELRKLEETLKVSASLTPNHQTMRFVAALKDAARALEHGKDLPAMDIATLERDGITPEALEALTPDDLLETMRNVVREAEHLSPRLADEQKRVMLDVETGKIKQIYSDRFPDFDLLAERRDRGDGLLSPVIENRHTAEETRDAAVQSFADDDGGRDGIEPEALRPVEIVSPSKTLEDADHRVKRAYELRGMNGDRALARIKGGLEATAATRTKWYDSEVIERHVVDDVTPEQAMADVEDLHAYASKVYRAATRAIGRGVSLDAIEVYAPKDAFADQLRQRSANEAALSADQRSPEPTIERDGLRAATTEERALSGEASDRRQVGDDRPSESKEARTRTEQPDTQELSPGRADSEEERLQHFAALESRIAEEDARIAEEEGLDHKPGLRRGR